MLYDLERGEHPEVDAFDYCVIGAGPAGITLARKLVGLGNTVLLLEAGGLSYSAQSQDIYRGESTGLQAWIEATRLRYLGGTSNHWAGRCRPFDQSDFDRDPPTDLPGWPITSLEVEPYLIEAMEILDISPDVGFRAINTEHLGDMFAPDKSALSPPTRFQFKYLQELEESTSIHVCINANATDMLLDQSGERVSEAIYKNFKKDAWKAKADVYIIAMGAIENARFLLNCNTQDPQGIGNASHMVGKAFMEHLNVSFGDLLYRNDEVRMPREFYTTENMLNTHPVGKGNVAPGVLNTIRAYGRTARIKEFFASLACRMNIEDKVQFIYSFQCEGDGTLGTLLEQFPNRNSHVTLSNQRDMFGNRRALLHWTLSESDLTSIRTIALEFAKAFSESGIGIIKLADFILDDSAEIVCFHHSHHMGTTRMADRPADGVVNADCKVFGVSNLYVAGSSIFATGGACNPTLPIIQFTLRLADHLLENQLVS